MKERVTWFDVLVMLGLSFGSILLSTGCGPAILTEEQAIEQEQAESVPGQPNADAPTGDDADDGGGTPTVDQ